MSDELLFENIPEEIQEYIRRFERENQCEYLEIERVWKDESWFDYSVHFGHKGSEKQKYIGFYADIIFKEYGSYPSKDEIINNYFSVEDFIVLSKYYDFNEDFFVTYRQFAPHESGEYIVNDSYRFAFVFDGKKGYSTHKVELRTKGGDFEKLPDELERYINDKKEKCTLLEIQQNLFNKNKYKLYLGYKSEFGVYAYVVVDYTYDSNNPKEYGSWRYGNTKNLSESILISVRSVKTFNKHINR